MPAYPNTLIYGRTTLGENVPVLVDADGKLVTTYAPAGSTTQVQFNSAGVMGASANLTWDGTNLRSSGYKSSDGSTGATVTTCTSFKNGLCVAGT